MRIAIYLTLFTILGLSAKEQLLESHFTEDEYAEVQTLYLKDTESKAPLCTFIQTEILPILPHQQAFLDIGAGLGEITREIASSFDSTTVIDPNSAYLDRYNSLGFSSYISRIQDVELSSSYDLILCAHVFYYIEKGEWRRVVQNIHRGLAQGGKGLLVYVAPTGPWHDFCLSIRPDYSTSSSLEQILREEHISYRKVRYGRKCEIPDREDFCRLVSLCVLSDCFTPDEFQSLSEEKKRAVYSTIDAYVTSCKSAGGYTVNWDEDLMIME
jgi:SAM-dependent methyltransferase